MKILLVAVNAKYIHSNLAVYSLKKAAERPAGEVEIAEYTINQQSFLIYSAIFTEGSRTWLLFPVISGTV